ncbi:protein mono-ADP-ribosyltransferase PARP4 isoform X2 [Tachysurus fulvidraco]|uniref:protein mono-ADP-ribosyltransferase PARP4 isoform X2 n=1 Tax=Tachysurus fulvidraco TaxID=1234273 RepID=UPI001FEFB7CF|nr:protein mono-ADP-ribosyltransferase PARP4 isoform X2 [Tachysurus fulvidraco]
MSDRMAIFNDCSVVLDLKNVPFKEKKKLMTAIVDNGGNISYVVNQKCTFMVASSLENISSSRLRSVQKHQTPVVAQQYVWSCLEKGLLLPVQEHVLKPQSSGITPEQAGLKSIFQPWIETSSIYERAKTQVKDGTYLGQFRLYKENDRDIPEFPSDFQVAKYSILFKSNTWSVLELQSAKSQAGQQYRVVSSIMHEIEKSVVWDKQVHSCSSEDAVDAYLMLNKELQVQGFTQTQTLPQWAENLTSHSLQQLLLEERLNCSTVSQEVGGFVELIWTETLGSLSSILTVPVTSISLNDVSRVEGLLLQVQKTQCEDEVNGLLDEVNTLLPLRIIVQGSKNKLVSKKLDICQLIRDILNMMEATLGNPYLSSLGKYRALRCSIEQVPSQSPEFLSVCQLLQDRPAEIQQILRVSRGAELHMFRNELGNIKSLLHSTASNSLVGILSRGLLLPRVGVEQHGIERTDIGNLGSGIYFSDSLNTSVKYSKPSVTDGSRLLLVCEVALGQCKDLHKRDFTLTSAPEGYNSVHGVCRKQKTHSDFEDDEYVVYNTDQIRLKYVVRYVLPEDEVKDFQPDVDMTLAPLPLASSSHFLNADDGEGLGVIKNSLEGVTAGLLDGNGQTLPLQAVHVRCKLMDLLSQVVIFQTYKNDSNVPIEAKYVFPLEETAAVCGFEAFINGKHVIGKVKEKEQARKEYKQAIEKGHGAYLMDQDAPDVFTISVGNLPPGATVLIKVTFITELVVRAGTIVFSLPGSVAPWQQSSAMNQRTQTTVEKICVNELPPKGEFSLSMSIEMPYEIMNLESSHRIKIKRTDCKAVVSTLPEQTLSTDGFRLSFTLLQIHMPRMWVEKHPEKDTEACMLVFYPHFESSGLSVSGVSDVIIVLDTSESMRGDAMQNARRIALKVLNSLDRSLRVNVISFGSDYKEAFPSPNLLEDVFEEAKNFIMSSTAVGGSTELWRPLRTLNLLPPSRGVRNVLLISDGHVQNQPQTLQLVRDNVRHTRLFTCGLNLTANRYMLRALAQAGGGTYEFFDTKTKYNWAEKVNSQVRCMVSPGCSSVAVKWRQFNPTAPSPVQAPSQLHALFSERHTLVYGFVPHCTQATLFGDLSGQEIETMVSTTELQKTKGTFLHKLTARAIIRDYEDGSLGTSEAEHEGKKAELKSYIIELSKEFSILSQFTSFVAVEERDKEKPDSGFTDVPKIIAEEDVDILPYMGWREHRQRSQESESPDIIDASELYVGSCKLSVPCDTYDSEEFCDADEFYPEVDYSDVDTYDDCLGFGFFDAPVMEDVQPTPESQTLHADITCTASIEPEGSLPSDSVYSLSESVTVSDGHVPLAYHSALSVNTSAGLMLAANLVSAPDTVDSHLVASAIPVALNLSTRSNDSYQSSEVCFFPPINDFAMLRSLSPPPAPKDRFKLKSASYGHKHDTPSQFLSTPSGPFRLSARRSNMAGFGLSRSRSDVSSEDSPSPGVYGSSDYIKTTFGVPPPPHLGLARCRASNSLPSPPLPGIIACFEASAPPPPPGVIADFAASAPSHSGVITHFAQSDSLPPPPPGVIAGFGAPAPSGVIASFRAPAPPLPGVIAGFGAPAPPPPQGVIGGFGAPPPPPPGVIDGFEAPALSGVIAGFGARDPPPPPPGVLSGFRAHVSSVQYDLFDQPLHTETDGEVSESQRKQKLHLVRSHHLNEVQSTLHLDDKLPRSFRKSCLRRRYRRPDGINWDELFNLQHQDGYWECSGTLSRFLGLDMDFLTNVFLKEKGICSLGEKAHAVILKMVATLLVLQLIRVKKMADGELLQSLFRLADHPEPRPACWAALKKAVEWVCWAERQYPCVYSRLEFGWDWESSTRQLLGLDPLPPFSPLIPVLQRSTHLKVM